MTFPDVFVSPARRSAEVVDPNKFNLEGECAARGGRRASHDVTSGPGLGNARGEQRPDSFRLPFSSTQFAEADRLREHMRTFSPGVDKAPRRMFGIND